MLSDRAVGLAFLCTAHYQAPGTPVANLPGGLLPRDTEGAEIALFFEGGGEALKRSTFTYGQRELEAR